MSKSFQRSAVSGQLPAGTVRAVGSRRSGFTLTEVMIVIGIIAILITVVAWGGSRLLSDAKVKQTHAVMNSLKSAMAACKAAGSLVAPANWSATIPVPQYPGASNLPATDDTSGKVVRTDYYRQAQTGGWNVLTMPTANREVSASDTPMDGIWALPDGKYQSDPTQYESKGYRIFGIQALYHCLMQDPQSKPIMSGLPPSSFAPGTKLKEYFGDQVSDYLIGAGAGTVRPHETQAILDAWGVPLHYGRETGVNNGEPYLQSAGPNGRFGDSDDVLSYKE
jgi:prepilin-type N-terminal cleavage/methylation domain-containing protein